MQYQHMGKQGRDRITGFSGTIVGFCVYISGCNQVLLAPKVKKDGSADDSRWYDEQRIAVTGKPLRLDNGKTPGPDAPAPIR